MSIRDYDEALIERPATGPPLPLAGPPRRVFVRLHDWDGPDSRLYTVRFFVLTETPTGWTLAQHATRYRAITSDALTRAAHEAGFGEVVWHTADDVGFHQPVMTATRTA
jgi:hypothetical protein